jgi:glycerol uptake facilitator protein
MLLVLLGDGVVANVLLSRTKGHQGGWVVIALGWAMAVFVGVSCAKDFSGAHLNPAVTIALAVAQQFAWAQVPAYILAQMLGAIVGAVLVWLHYRQHFAATEDANLKLGVFCTGPAIRSAGANLFSEMVGTFVLVFAVLFIVDPSFAFGTPATAPGVTTKIGLGTLGALPVALIVLAIGLCLGGTTGYAINPARDLGPRIAHAILPIPAKRDSDWNYAWIPIVGPILGGIAAVVLWRGLAAL